VSQAVSPEASASSVAANDGAAQAERSTGELYARESYSGAGQPAHERARVDSMSTSPTEVVAAQALRGIDASVVGQSFPVSESVVEHCKPAKPAVFRWEACDRVNELLVKMTEEPRDESWAEATEKLLRAYAEGEPGNFTIRSVECRKTICFIETASIVGGLPIPDYRFLRNSGLKKDHPVAAFETDPTGARITISLLPIIRL
jgi:hypothetical protein